jgi:anti-sigma regulatory factor (Ser/Thr protein kinase)
MLTSSDHHTGCDAADELRLPARASQLSTAREYAWWAAAACGLDTQTCDDFMFAVNEAVTNAIRHGAPDEHGLISILARVDGEGVTLSVRDYGTFAASTAGVSALAESGRGFALMARLTDAVQLCVGRGTTTVRLSKATRPPARRGE